VREQYRFLTQSTTGLGNLNGTTLNEIQLPFIPLSEQQQIVSFLDTKTSLIDSLIEKTKLKIQLLKEKRQKLIEEVLLNPNTKRVRLQYVVHLIQRPIDREENETYTKVGMFNWGRGIFKYPSELGSELGDSTFNYLQEGDLLLSGQFSWEGSVSIVNKEENNCISSHRFHILNGINGKILNEYLWSYFTSQEGHFLLNENSPGSAGRNRPLNIGKLLKEKIPVPEMSVQKEIQKLVIEMKNYEKYSSHRTELLKEYRQSLISEVVTGKRKVVD
jgi:type I restriction enzyme S subunit